MPLVRTQVRNEYGLGNADLYLEPSRRGDPKAVLDGVAVSGLVGILRQLGDLAGFAADIFHDLHEQVAATSARSHRMMARVQRLESSFPAIEKNIHSLKGHIHLAYLPGSDWHSDAQIEHGRLLASELPRFLMDSYEECRDPPRLFLLDKFDSGGAGSCLRKYSDPTYFRRTWADSHVKEADRSIKERKRKKMKGLRMRNVEMLHVTSLPHRSDRTWFSSPSSDEGNTVVDDVSSSVNVPRQRREIESDTESFDSRTSLVDMNPVPIPSASSSAEFDESCYKGMLASNIISQQPCEHNSVQDLVGVDGSLGSSREDKVPRSSSVTWDEKIELPLASNPKLLDIDLGEKDHKNRISDSECSNLETESNKLRMSFKDGISVDTRSVPHQENLQFSTGNTVSLSSTNGFCEEVNSEAENYVDALNSLDSEADTDLEFQTKWEVKPVLSTGCPTDSMGSGESEKLASGSISSGGNTNTISNSYRNNQTSPECASSFTAKDTRHLPSLHVTEGGNAAAMVPDRNNGEQLVSAALELHIGPEVDSIANKSDVHNTYETHRHNEVDDLSSTSTLATSAHNFGGTYLREETQEFCKLSVEIWTNGGLLGLKPSKPSDFCTAGTVSQSPSATNENKSQPECTTGFEQNDNFANFDEARGSKENMWGNCSLKDIDELNSSSKLSQLYMQKSVDLDKKQDLTDDHERKSDKFEVSVSQVPTNCKLEETVESQSPNILYDQQNKTRNSAAAAAKKKTEGFKVRRTECSLQEINANQGPESITRQYGSSEEVNFKLFHLYPLSPPSPPLEHMKISFHPLNRNMTSKLKLEFTENHVDESVDELTFPAFQLLPEAHASMEHISSDSDDDTFCRSSHYSENVFSPHSDVDSETWEQDEHSLSGNDDIHNVENTISSIASMSSSLERNGVKHTHLNGETDSKVTQQENDCPSSLQSSHLLDIPGLESLKPSISRHDKNCDTGLNEFPDLTFRNQNELPPLPPLPPLEWRKMKPIPVSGEFRNHLSEVLNQMKGKGSPNLTEPASVNGVSTRKELVASMNGAQVGGRNGEKKFIGPITTDEREDFLQQIRNKSFNLRRTSLNRPNFMPEPVANIQVAAILEKANTIRQAFAGSDGGEDDNWSDG